MMNARFSSSGAPVPTLPADEGGDVVMAEAGADGQGHEL